MLKMKARTSALIQVLNINVLYNPVIENDKQLFIHQPEQIQQMWNLLTHINTTQK